MGFGPLGDMFSKTDMIGGMHVDMFIGGKGVELFSEISSAWSAVEFSG